jgi:hypothetical protein
VTEEKTMPLLDHFHNPMKRRLPWTALHSGWATYLASHLIDNWLPSTFIAVEHTYRGTEIEIDVATYETPAEGPSSGNGGAVATQPRTWTAPAALATVPFEFPDCYEVLVYSDDDGWELVAAIELVSKRNKDRPGRRRSFVRKCASLLDRGVSVVILDIVTSRHANLHNQLLRQMGVSGPAVLGDDVWIYASAYRPLQRDGRTELQVWAERCVLGSPLPTMPLRLTGDLVVPVEFEATYQEICSRRKLI